MLKNQNSSHDPFFQTMSHAHTVHKTKHKKLHYPAGSSYLITMVTIKTYADQSRDAATTYRAVIYKVETPKT